MSRKSLKDLLKQCTELRRYGRKTFELAQTLVDVARLYQQKESTEDRISAISAAKEAVEILLHSDPTSKNQKEISRAYRCLAEIFAELNDHKMARQYADKFLKSAQLSGNHSQIQLSFHVTAWIIEKLWVLSGSVKSADLEEAYKYAQKSLSYLEQHSSDISSDREEVERSDPPEIRRGNLERLLAGIAGNLGRRNECEKYFKNAMNIAIRRNLSDLKYELQISQLDFPWVNKRKLAQILVNEAPSKRKASAKLELSQVLIYEGDMERAFRVLLDIKTHAKIHEDDLELVNSRLIFVYKCKEALQKISKTTISQKEKRKLYEKLGDLILDYSSTSKECLSLAVQYYNKMLLYSAIDKERIPALVSLGSTYFDLGLYPDALRNFTDCLECEKRIRKPTEKTLATRILIFNTKCKGCLGAKSELESILNELLAAVPSSKRLIKRNLCTHMAEFLKLVNDPQANFYEEEAQKYQGNRSQNSDDELSEDDSSDSEQNDDRSDSEILRECERKAKQLNDDEHIDKRKNWKNSHGETELHIEAKGDNIVRLQKLLFHKYPVNAQDNSGWTALHEAINHKKVDNVKLLLANGARVDIASCEGDDGGLDDGRIGGKITPLMDACANFTEGLEMIVIAEILFRHSPDSVTRKNEDGWTAADFIIDSIAKLEAEGEIDCIPRAKALLTAMEKQFIKQGVPFRHSPPQLKKRRHSVENRPKKSLISRVEGSAINNIGSRAKRPGNKMDQDSEEVLNHLSSSPSRHSLDDMHDFQIDNDSLTMNGFDPFTDENIYPESSSSYTQIERDFQRERRVITPRSHTQVRTRNDDNFIVQDIIEPSRKRKNRDGTPKAKRLSERNFILSDEEDLSPDIAFDETPASSSDPRQLRRSNSVERVPYSVKRSAKSEDVSGVEEPLELALPKQNHYMQIPAKLTSTPKLSVTIVFVDSSGTQIRNNLVTAIDSTATIKTIHDKCEKNLANHQKNFSICLEDGTEVDCDMPLSLLKRYDTETVKFKCVIQKATAQALFQSYNEEFKYETEIIQRLQRFSLPDIPAEIDFSMIEVDQHISAILRSLIESGKPVLKLNLTHCDLGNVDGTTLGSIISGCHEFIARSSNLSDNILQIIIQSGVDFSKLVNLDISFNPITSFGVASIISLCPALNKLTLKGINLQDAADQIVDTISGLSELKHLDIQNANIPSGPLEHLFSSCQFLNFLDVGSTEITFPFSPCWLPTLRELKLSACVIHSWESFIDWISLGAVEKIDLSCTLFTPDHVLSLCDRRIETTTNLLIRLLRCPHIEHGIEGLKDGILQFLESKQCPIRMQLPSEITRHLKLETALTPQFLID